MNKEISFFKEYKRYLTLLKQSRIYIRQQHLGNKEAQEARRITSTKLKEELRTNCEKLGISSTEQKVLVTLYERFDELSKIKGSEEYLTDTEKELLNFFRDEKIFKEIKPLFDKTSISNLNRLYDIFTNKKLNLEEVLVKLNIKEDNANLICLRALMGDL